MNINKFRKPIIAVFVILLCFSTHELYAYSTKDLIRKKDEIRHEQLMCPLVDAGKIPSRSQQGCCNKHGGVLGCGYNGRTVCRDCTYSPSCHCN